MLEVRIRFILCLVFLNIPYAFSGPVQPTDNFISPCSFMPPHTPPNGFKLWSDPTTWSSTVIPGVGSGVNWNVTIPCGVAVLLNVPSVELHTLRVQGFLKFLDAPNLPSIYLRAHYILVEGQFSIGSTTQQFENSVTIELTPNTEGNRQSLSFSSNSPADSSNPRSLGHKAFVVVGGQIRLHGLPIPPSMPVWGKLTMTANVGDRVLTINRAVSWPVGSEIVVTSTDYDRYQSEVFKITKSVITTFGTTRMNLDKSFQYMHYGDPVGLPDGFGGFLDQCAEVALLSRNIIVKGTDEPAPYDLEGGHFMIFHTQIQQFVEGVEFRGMGQQGKLGRYPIHFHLNGDQGSSQGTVCRKNTVRDSKQRCIVVHGTLSMTIEENVAYNIKGHCFLTEEGGETNTTFVRNIGILVDPVTNLIPKENFTSALPETDDQPSVFWISHPTNHLINNVAVGSADSGIWFEMRSSVRGLSRKWSRVNQTNPVYNPLGRVIGNTVHSNNLIGFRLYPHGLLPRVNGVPVISTIWDLNSYKNSWMGILSHNNDGLVFQNATLSDNRVGIFMKSVENVVLRSSRVVGFSNNWGNPTNCESTSPWASCRPTLSCKLPLPRGEAGRTVGWIFQMYPNLGVQMNQNVGPETGNYPNAIVSTRFSNFNNTCWPAAAIGLTGEEKLSFWNAANNVQNLRFTINSNRLWMAPQVSNFTLSLRRIDAGEAAKFYTLRDLDGSLTGFKGYAVANNVNILPSNPSSCNFRSEWNAYSCSQTCYRSISVEYYESSFYNNPNAGIGDFSSINVVRISDGKSFRANGNFQQKELPWWADDKKRYFYFTVLSGMTYSITFNPSSKNPSFYPSSMEIHYRDGVGCGVGVSIQVRAPTNRQWIVSPSPSVFYRPCSGSMEVIPNPTYYNYICNRNSAVLEISLWPRLPDSISLFSSTTSTACGTTSECGILNMGNPTWAYDTSGTELRPFFINPLFNFKLWKRGSAPFGFRDGGQGSFRTLLPRPSKDLLTYYYRTNFFLQKTSCYTRLNVEVLLNDGVVIYLNGRELLRANMPSGPVTSSSLALKMVDGDSSTAWRSIPVPLINNNDKVFLVENINSLVAEVHPFKPWAWQSTFDIRISALQLRGKCEAPKVTPEVCDGVDNNNNGKIDEGPNNHPLQRTCFTSCGKGIETCVGGAWVNCTAPSMSPERCNNIDDNCDGLIDNGLNQLDCPVGKACFRGKCQTVTSLFVPVTVWAKNSTKWNYFDKGTNLDMDNSQWRNGSLMAGWSVGNAPLGYNEDASNSFSTALNPGRKSFTTYFRKTFDLVAQEVATTYSIGANVRRDDGVIIYLNGIEIFRDNMPDGNVNRNTPSLYYTQSNGTWNSKFTYYPCTGCSRNTSSIIKIGTNFLAAEVHQADSWSQDVAFDLELIRNMVTPCGSGSSSPSSCIHAQEKKIIFFDFQTSWRYLDASLPLPPSNWMSSNYSDINWLQGVGFLGYGVGTISSHLVRGGGTTAVRITQYFRKSFQVSDSNCYFELILTLYANDGAVVYLNGVEVFRQNMALGTVTPNTFASTWGRWQQIPIVLTGNWLFNGINTIAIELHNYALDSKDAIFGSKLEGRQEGFLCAPV